MGRAWREEYQGGIYHVIARENNKEYIFKESINKGCFIKLLKQSIDGMNYHIGKKKISKPSTVVPGF